MNKKINLLVLLFFIFLFAGCSVKPSPYKHTKDTLKYDNEVIIDIENKNLKFYVDNKFDIDKRIKTVNTIIGKLSNLTYNPMIKEKKVNRSKNILEVTGIGVPIESSYALKYDLESLFIRGKDETFIPKENIKKTNNGFIIKGLENRAAIIYLYDNYINYINEIPGTNVNIKIDGKDLDNNIANFTDEYLRKYSLKKALEDEIKKNGYRLVNNINDADIVISTENLLFGTYEWGKDKIRYPQNYYITYYDLVRKTDSSENYKLPINTTLYFDKYFNTKHPNTKLGTYGVAVGLLHLFDQKTPPISTISSIKIFKNKKPLGRVADVSVAINKISKPYEGLIYSFNYNSILSIELIEELNKQAAKRVFSKIKFIEKKD